MVETRKVYWLRKAIPDVGISTDLKDIRGPMDQMAVDCPTWPTLGGYPEDAPTPLAHGWRLVRPPATRYRPLFPPSSMKIVSKVVPWPLLESKRPFSLNYNTVSKVTWPLVVVTERCMDLCHSLFYKLNLSISSACLEIVFVESELISL